MPYIEGCVSAARIYMPFLLHLASSWTQGGWSLSQLLYSCWTGYQSVPVLTQRQTSIRTYGQYIVESPIRLTQRTQREPRQMQGEHAQVVNSNSGSSRCETTLLTSTPPCIPFHRQIKYFLLEELDDN